MGVGVGEVFLQRIRGEEAGGEVAFVVLEVADCARC